MAHPKYLAADGKQKHLQGPVSEFVYLEIHRMAAGSGKGVLEFVSNILTQYAKDSLYSELQKHGKRRSAPKPLTKPLWKEQPRENPLAKSPG